MNTLLKAILKFCTTNQLFKLLLSSYVAKHLNQCTAAATYILKYNFTTAQKFFHSRSFCTPATPALS